MYKHKSDGFVSHVDTSQMATGTRIHNRQVSNGELSARKSPKPALQIDLYQGKEVYSSLNDLIDDKLREELQFSEDELTTTAGLIPAFVNVKFSETHLHSSANTDLEQPALPKTGWSKSYQTSSRQTEELLSPWRLPHPSKPVTKVKQTEQKTVVTEAPRVVNRLRPVREQKPDRTQTDFKSPNVHHTPETGRRTAVNRKVLRDALSKKAAEHVMIAEYSRKNTQNTTQEREISAEPQKPWIQDLHGTYKSCSSKSKKEGLHSTFFPVRSGARWVLFNENKYRVQSESFKKKCSPNLDNKMSTMIKSFFDESNSRITKESMRRLLKTTKQNDNNRSQSQDDNKPKVSAPPEDPENYLTRRIWLKKKHLSEARLNGSGLFSDQHIRTKKSKDVELKRRVVLSTRLADKPPIHTTNRSVSKPTPVLGTWKQLKSDTKDSDMTLLTTSHRSRRVHIIGLQPQAKYLSSTRQQTQQNR